MTLHIPDEVLAESGLTEREMLIELACRLYDSGKLSKSHARLLAGLGRDEFNAELAQRGLAVIHYSQEDLDRDVQTLGQLEETGFWSKRR
jgi:predicted HTH domain antitoxin